MFRKYDENEQPIRKRIILSIPEDEEIRVEQNHKDEVNINNIVKRHGMDLIAKTAALQQFTFDDNPNNDFQETMNAILRAQESFDSIPSDIRKQFDNNPAQFLDFIHNPENKAKLVKMGLANPEPEKTQPIEVVVTNPPETPPAE